MTTEPATDAELLARLRVGDSSAVGAIFERYEQPVFRYLLGVLKDRHAAEDVLQDTFVLVLRKAEAAAGESFRGWLFTVAHQQALLFRRKGQSAAVGGGDGLLSVVSGDADPLAAADAHEMATTLRGLLEQLPEPQRAVICLRLFDGLKFREVADRLGCPLNTALARMHDGLARLRTLWEQRYA
ncbi:MAG: RNA polymerase sigma factor [Fimbriiglobus sp.]|nr:RNA polymerase sigma factor [Fimbriiglobus sp.]